MFVYFYSYYTQETNGEWVLHHMRAEWHVSTSLGHTTNIADELNTQS